MTKSATSARPKKPTTPERPEVSATSGPIKIIFFGNGPLADAALSTLEPHFDIIFHARTRDDLATVRSLKQKHPEAFGVLASYGVLIKSDLLDLFEPTGILNLHPSLLPLYRGPSPIETAILRGDTTFGISVMKLAPAMDAGPLYYQTTLDHLPLDKAAIYHALAEAGADWLVQNLPNLPTPVAQNDQNATYTAKITKEMGHINPATETAEEILQKIIAFQGFPKVKYAFYGQNSAILAAHILEQSETAPLTLTGSDGQILAIDLLQPDGRRPMDAKSFLNGYKNNAK